MPELLPEIKRAVNCGTFEYIHIYIYIYIHDSYVYKYIFEFIYVVILIFTYIHMHIYILINVCKTCTYICTGGSGPHRYIQKFLSQNK
jgi:hypothetical protein